METQNQQQEEQVPLTPEQLQEIRLARRCFSNFERLISQMLAYPPGHPNIENAAKLTTEGFNELFQITDRLSVQVQPHAFRFLETEEDVWETEEPRDYCFMLSRDGIFLFHMLAGIDEQELKKLAKVFNVLIERRNDRNLNVVVELFEANFRYISYDALDESLAALAGIDLDMRNRDTKEEQEMIEDLFNKATKDEEGQNAQDAKGNFEIRIKNPADRIKKIDVGSREFLALDDELKKRLNELKLGFTEHKELEHREGEILSAILGAKPKEKLRVQAVDQIGEVMSQLLETEQPWEALTFLKIIHHWRDKFAPEVTHELKEIVSNSFNRQTIQELTRQSISTGKRQRRMILQMFNALHLEEASTSLARVVAWDIDPEAREDILRYLKERARFGFEFLEEVIMEVPVELAPPLFEMLEQGIPDSRDILVNVLRSSREPDFKVMALKPLSFTWSDPTEIRMVLVPLTQSKNSELRLEAIRQVAQSVPQHVFRTLEPLFSDEMRKRPEEEIREMAQIFVNHGGPPAVEKLKSIVHRRGLTTSESERELAIRVVRALLMTSQPEVTSMLEAVAKDWLVPQQIRNACKEVADMLNVGRS